MTPTELRAVLLERLPADPKWTAWVEGVVERVGTVEDPRIARITAFCEDMFESADPEVWTYAHQLRALLGEVQPTPRLRLDRQRAATLLPWNLPHAMSVEEWLDALEECVVRDVCDNPECDWRGTAHQAEHPCGQRVQPDDEPRRYVVTVHVESWGTAEEVRQEVNARLAPAGLMPKAIRVVPRSLGDAS